MQWHAICSSQTSLSNTNSWAKENGIWTFHLRLNPFPYKKRIGCSLKAIEKKNRGIEVQQVPTKWIKTMPFLLRLRVQSCKQDSYWEENRNHTSKQHIPPLQNVGVLRRTGWCTKTYHFVWDKKLLAPIHFAGFLQNLAINSYKRGVWHLGVKFSGVLYTVYHLYYLRYF